MPPGGVFSPPAFSLLFFFALFHVVEDPVPHDEETGDDYIREQSCAEECPGDDKLVVHDPYSYQASAATPSAQVSIRVRIPSSS